jgi:hypothetical protein
VITDTSIYQGIDLELFWDCFMFSPLKVMICMLLVCLASPAIAGCEISSLSPDTICTQGFGLEKGSEAYQSCMRKKQDQDVARSQFDATLSTIRAELQILAKEKIKLSSASTETSAKSLESILRRERELITKLEELKILTGC